MTDDERWQAIAEKARELMQLAAPVWHRGDGTGGLVFDEIGVAASDAGLERPSWWGAQPGIRTFPASRS